MITYKLKQTKEEWNSFNDRVVRTNIEYQIDLVVPKWLDLLRGGALGLEQFTGLDYLGQQHYDANNYVFSLKYVVRSKSKCDLSRDKFDEGTGLYICETRSELKALDKIEKVIKALYKLIGSEDKDREDQINKLQERIDKNTWNLERLKGTYEETED
jgi:hypothetical protein